MADVRILVTGASGFIGRRLTEALHGQGHEVICAGRRPNPAHCSGQVLADFTRDVEMEHWAPRLAGVEVVINAVGILREHGTQTFERIHFLTPQALFRACEACGVRRVIQISALGADEQASSAYHISKRRADAALAALPVDWVVLQPSLVYGPGGTSARFLTALASLPWIPLPGRGDQCVQPIHIDDLVAGVVALTHGAGPSRTRIPFVGPRPITLREMLAALRASMGLGPARFVPIPLWLVRSAARLGALVRTSLLDPETLGMLLRGNMGDPQTLRNVLGREPRAVTEFVAPAEAPSVRTLARLQWQLPLLRWSVAAVWIVTGIVSLGIYPVQSSYELLARVGVSGGLAPVLLYGAAAMDLAFGIATLALKKRRWLWLAQIAAITLYSLIIAVKLPEFWLHPFGPLLKNVPLVALIAFLYSMERR
jgi:nucleoside-diphosphate-sugar epimerase